MKALPIFVPLVGRRCLVIGGGRVARQKAARLAAADAAVECVEPADFADALLDGCALVIAATRARAFNRRVAEACRARRIPVNVVDDPDLCTFFFGAVAEKGPLTVAVSSGGTCPVAAQVVRDRVRPLLTDGLAEAAARLGAERDAWKARCPDPKERAAEMRRELEKC